MGISAWGGVRVLLMHAYWPFCSPILYPLGQTHANVVGLSTTVAPGGHWQGVTPKVGMAYCGQIHASPSVLAMAGHEQGAT